MINSHHPTVKLTAQKDANEILFLDTIVEQLTHDWSIAQSNW